MRVCGHAGECLYGCVLVGEVEVVVVVVGGGWGWVGARTTITSRHHSATAHTQERTRGSPERRADWGGWGKAKGSQIAKGAQRAHVKVA